MQLSAYPQTPLNVRWLAQNYPPCIRQVSAMYEHDDLQLHLATRVGMKGKLYRKQTNSPTGTDKSPHPSDSS